MTILERLEKLLPLASRTTFREMLKDRRVTVNGLVVTSLKEPLRDGDAVNIAPKSATRAGKAAARDKSRKMRPPAPIVFEDEDFVILNKPQGLITSSGPHDKRPTLIGLLRAYYEIHEKHIRIGLVHRLDADAGGLMVFSKNAGAHAGLKQQFADHSVERVYVALLDGAPKTAAGRIDTKLVELADGRVRSTHHPDKGERAVTHYETLKVMNGQALVRVRLETGRKHQIRAHFFEKDCPIVNDRIYCPRFPEAELRLIAVALGFDHPRSGKPMRWELPMPKWAVTVT